MKEVSRGYDDRDRRADVVRRNEVRGRKSQVDLEEQLNENPAYSQLMRRWNSSKGNSGIIKRK